MHKPHGRFIKHFPALHLKADRWDYFANFSSELLVLGLIILVAGFNLFGLSLGSFAAANRDHSLAEQLLGNHYALNQKLYNETHVINTSVAGTGLVAEAYADTASTPGADTDADLIDDNYTDEGALTNENLSNVKDLIKLNIHVSKPGETLSAIAADCGLSVEEVKTANRLTSDTIKAGWNIVCFKGVAYTATANDTLPDVAKYFSGNLDQIIAYNALSGPEDIQTGQLIFIPGGHYPAPKVSPKPNTPSRSIYAVPANGLYKGRHNFPASQCTYLAAQLFGQVTWGGNAGRWDDNARAQGYPVDKHPRVGSIVVTNESRVGHVGYVIAVNSDSITIKERNYIGPYKDDVRNISIHSSVIQAYIHHK